MSEEKHSLQHEAEHETPSKRPNVFGYLAVLFAVALLLLGMSYLMQQRENEAALHQSVSALQSVEALLTENETLRGEVARLETELRALRAENAALHASIRGLEADLQGKVDPMDVLQALVDLGVVDLDKLDGEDFVHFEFGAPPAP